MARERRRPILKLTFEVRGAAEAQVFLLLLSLAADPLSGPEKLLTLACQKCLTRLAPGQRPVKCSRVVMGPPTENTSESLIYSLIYFTSVHPVWDIR